MRLSQKITRLSLVAALLSSLAACTVAPIYPVGYRAQPAYVNSYPGYGYSNPPSATVYYQSNNRRYYDDDDRRRPQQRSQHEYRYQESPRNPSLLESAAETHRNIRRSLGLPRLPGMP